MPKAKKNDTENSNRIMAHKIKIKGKIVLKIQMKKLHEN